MNDLTKKTFLIDMAMIAVNVSSKFTFYCSLSVFQLIVQLPTRIMNVRSSKYIEFLGPLPFIKNMNDIIGSIK